MLDYYVCTMDTTVLFGQQHCVPPMLLCALLSVDAEVVQVALKRLGALWVMKCDLEVLGLDDVFYAQLLHSMPWIANV